MNEKIFARLVREAEHIISREPMLEPMMTQLILSNSTFAEVLCSVLTSKLEDPFLTKSALASTLHSAYAQEAGLESAAAADAHAVLLRDAATDSLASVVLHQKGFQAIQLHRVAHWLWLHERRELALCLQGLSSRVFGVDIHPACRMGKGTMFDHATGIVIGETCVIGDNVSIMQSVTLGGTGKHRGDRHPKIHDGVLIGSGAKLLGNIVIGEGAKIGAGSVVLKDVPPHTTVVGVPAQIVGQPRSYHPAEEMDHNVFSDLDWRQDE